jgi:hypothetical protein
MHIYSYPELVGGLISLTLIVLSLFPTFQQVGSKRLPSWALPLLTIGFLSFAICYFYDAFSHRSNYPYAANAMPGYFLALIIYGGLKNLKRSKS